MIETKTITETNRFIVLDRYDIDWRDMDSYQSEDALEREVVHPATRRALVRLQAPRVLITR